MDYENFKTLVALRTLPWYYRETTAAYHFTTWEGPLTFSCEIYKAGKAPEGKACDDDKVADFEANYKSTAINIS